MAFQGDSARKSRQAALDFAATPAPSPETAREKIRQLIYGSGKHKSLAIELYGKSSPLAAQSRLSRAIGDDPDVSFDIDDLVPALRHLGDEQAMDFLATLCAEFGAAPVKVQKETVEDRIARLERAVAGDEAVRVARAAELADIKQQKAVEEAQRQRREDGVADN